MAPPDRLQIVRLIHGIAHQTDEIFDRLLQAEFALTVARFRILVPLIELGPMTQADIARFQLLTEASIARQVRILVADGYLKRVADEKDGRKYLLILTSKTEALLPNIKVRLGEEIARVYHPLSVTELKTIAQTLKKLKALGEAESNSTFGTCLDS